MNYYNDIDPHAAAWLKNLILAGLIPSGVVDTRPIQEVLPGDLAGFTQCHFFAGIGGWSLALAFAGWRADEPVWTGSCPCQPFSTAGAGAGNDDPRSLWWAFRWLIAQCKPAIVFGEQVASKDGREWLAGVRADLETLGYAVGAADLCAAGVGAPHIRQRLYWLADAEGEGRQRDGWFGERSTDGVPEYQTTVRSTGQSESQGLRHDSRLPDTQQQRSQGSACQPVDSRGEQVSPGRDSAISWGTYEWVPCADGKARRIEPRIAPLVDGLPGRVGLIRGYGNAIVPQVAARFIEAYLEVTA